VEIAPGAQRAWHLLKTEIKDDREK
jgi:hypothetical protein